MGYVCVHRSTLGAGVWTQPCSCLLRMVARGSFLTVLWVMSEPCLKPSCATLSHVEYNPAPQDGLEPPLSGPSSPLLLLSPIFHHSALDTLTTTPVTLAHPVHSTPGPLHGLFSFRNLLSPADSPSSLRNQLISPLRRKRALTTRAKSWVLRLFSASSYYCPKCHL